MSGNRYLLDTNILIVSIHNPAGRTSAQALLHDIPVIDITAEIKERTIELRKKYNLRSSGFHVGGTSAYMIY